MDGKIEDSSFVVITGPPQNNKRERISHVRSHIRKSRLRRERYHQQWKQRQAIAPLVPDGSTLGSSLTRQLTQTIDLSWLSVSDSIRKRIISFFNQYFQRSAYMSQLFCTMIPVMVVDIPFMSTKLVTASAWDDLNGPNREISDLTLSQRNISENILVEFATDPSLTSSAYIDVTITAILGLISFDIVHGDRSAYTRHKRLVCELVERQGGVDKLGFNGNIRLSLLMIDRLERVTDDFCQLDLNEVDIFQKGDNLGRRSFLSQPTDFTIFTFQSKNTQESKISLSSMRLLNDFFQLVMLSIRYQQLSALQPGRDQDQEKSQERQQILTSWYFLYNNFIALKSMPFHVEADVFDRILLYSILLFFPSSHDNIDTQESVHELRSLMLKYKIDSYHSPLPGALMWSTIIGARRSPSGSAHRKWFLMQLIRIACPLAIDHDPAIVTGNFDMILEALSAVENLRKENELL